MSISKTEYRRRRKNLMALMEPNSIAIVPSAQERLRTGDTPYPFRQDSDFYYLSGFSEPESVIVLSPGRKHGEFILFCRERDPRMEMWNGFREGPEGVCEHYAADDAFPIGDIDDILPGLIEGRERVYYSMGRSRGFDTQIMGWVNSIRSKESYGAVPPGELTDLSHMIHDLRLVKSAAEQRVLRKAAQITALGHVRAMRACRPGQNEFELEAELSYEFARNGARHLAYPCIVGGGINACTLHYLENNSTLREGELVLIDAGCEFEHYASDVTRTFPVSGQFSAEQRVLYEIVLEAQRAAIAAIRPGNDWNQPHTASVNLITEGLLELGLLRGRKKQLIEKQAYREFYMHRVGHWLGLDVHDPGDYRVGDQWRQLEVGMVMTVEPGIYVSQNNTTVAKKWRGIGIRIEDDVLVTTDGCEVLSESVPKEVDEIESVMAA